MMEIRLSIALLCLLAATAYSLTAASPRAQLPPHVAHDLGALEDAFAEDRGDLGLARRLAAEYLRLGHATLAIAAVRAADAPLLEDPVLTYRLALAYEHAGRLDDALATSHLALARCLRAFGSSQAVLGTPPPAYSCTPGTLVQLEMQAQALLFMNQWGITDVHRDPRVRLAHDLADRRATIASLAD